MATRSTKGDDGGRVRINVTFVGLGADAQPPATALYRYAEQGKPPEKLGRVEGGQLNVDPAKLKGAEVALGPDVGDAATLDPATLIRFRGDQVAAARSAHPRRPLGTVPSRDHLRQRPRPQMPALVVRLRPPRARHHFAGVAGPGQARHRAPRRSGRWGRPFGLQHRLALALPAAV